MAELIAVPVNFLLEKAVAVAADRVGMMWRFSKNLEAMGNQVNFIQTVLADAERKQSAGNEPVKVWLKDVEGAVFEAEIVLDELLYENLRRMVYQTNSGGKGKVCSFFSLKIGSRLRDVYFCMKMSSRVQGINEKLERFHTNGLGIGLTRDLLNRDVNVTVEAADRQTHYVPQHYVAGREREESEIVNMLLGSSDDNVLVPILPIVGMGGLGKTTLAKSIYNNKKIVDHFGKRCWICMYGVKSEIDLLKRILEYLNGGKEIKLSSGVAIIQGIEEKLKGERFLFVLDDVWELMWWDDFLNFLKYVAGFNSTGGSCCVLTTRLHEVANRASVFFGPCEMKKLPDDDCWSIIGRRAMKGGEMPKELNIHKEPLLKRCQGLPLAANAIGGLLSSQCREEWGSIVEKILKIRENVEGEVEPILKLSYDYLPSRCIKKCFVYCSVYLKDTKLNGEELIELWMAEGFLQEGVEGRTMEEVGAHYLTVLLHSSLLEKHPIYKYGFQMHDLVHDLAESISRKQHVGDKHPMCRRFVFLEGNMERRWNEQSMLAQMMEGEVSDEMLLEYKHARVMHLFSGEIMKLPNAIGKLKHICCLTLSLGGIKSLPDSLCKLYNLQTLRLSGCDHLQCLPQGLSNLISLRHLHFWREEEFKMPPNMGRLACLQTLSFFNVWEENGNEIKELGFMENLKGRLSIRNLQVVKGKEEAASAKLDAKKNMINLEFKWNSSTGHNNSEDVLEGLEPCSALQYLKITNFMGVRIPRWLAKLSALVSLQLYDCENIRELGYSGDIGFPNLKTLLIMGCHLLSSAPTSFPILETLDVTNIQVSVVRDIISTTTNSLENIWLYRVSGMRSLFDVTESSLSSSLKKLQIWYCDDLTEIPSSTLECCACLEELLVIGCPELGSCPLNLQQTPCLSKLKLTECPKLFIKDGTLPRGFDHLTNLKELWIEADNSEQFIDWDALKTGCSTTLRSLQMYGSCRTELPQQLEHFSSLVKLHISKFDSLERLPGWLGKLMSLQQLYLEGCPKLEHLPTDAIRSLSNLERLRIERCPLLRETQGDEIKALPRVHWRDY